MSPWSEALDDFERQLEGYRQVLEHDAEPTVGAWPPPAAAGQQLPAELVPRARQLLGQAGELESLIRIKQDALRLRGALGPRRRPFVGRPARSAEL
jgi:hypothetical protein